jgi:N-acetylglutamate synthase-like GNAT family acetyltransferase
MEDITYGPASPDDLPAVKALLERCELPTEDLRPDQLAHFVVCRAQGGLVGAVGLEVLGGVGLLRSLAVAPEVRGRGLAHDLWARVRAEARRRDVRRLYLLTTTAAPLFSKWGFRSVTRDSVPEVVRATPEYSLLCPSTATVMTMDLGATWDQRVL